MPSPPFVAPHSIVRRIWGASDTILVVFAGAAAEFALNRAVDWLYFTGRLPADPLGRLFSTVAYARRIVFSDRAGAYRAIDTMAHIHAAVEGKREERIPDWAYRDVLFLLIDYSIRSFELLERPLSTAERTEVFTVFYRVGDRMGVRGLPTSYPDWVLARKAHLESDLTRSPYTDDLFRQYRRHLGTFRYLLLREAQLLVVPDRVRYLLGMRGFSLLRPLVVLYRLGRGSGLDWLIKQALLPPDHKEEIMALDQPHRT